ncbi:MAG TPA: hypothetical protein DCE47_12015 [Planctomycetaceae bacterium]|nr:hypothetical protein [Planctomycetaceae bacterium]
MDVTVLEGGMRRRVIEWPSRLLVLGSLLLSGCLVNQNTRMPQPRPRHPKAERHSFEFHDPFPSAELGPVGGPRPPGMTQPRTEARRAMEQRAAHGGTRPRAFWLPSWPNVAPGSSPQPLLPQVVPD